MPKITELAKMLYSHSRDIHVKVYNHHIVYTIPTYHDYATPKLVSLADNGYGSMILTLRRNEPTAFVSGNKLISGEYNRTDGHPNTPDANRSLWKQDEIWKLPL